MCSNCSKSTNPLVVHVRSVIRDNGEDGKTTYIKEKITVCLILIAIAFQTAGRVFQNSLKCTINPSVYEKKGVFINDSWFTFFLP